MWENNEWNGPLADPSNRHISIKISSNNDHAWVVQAILVNGQGICMYRGSSNSADSNSAVSL